MGATGPGQSFGVAADVPEDGQRLTWSLTAQRTHRNLSTQSIAVTSMGLPLILKARHDREVVTFDRQGQDLREFVRYVDIEMVRYRSNFSPNSAS